MSCLHEILRVPISRRCDGYYLRWYYNGWHYWFFYPGKINFITEGEKYRTLGTRKMTIGTGQITQEQCDAIRTIMNTTEIYIFTDVGWGVVRVDPGTWTVYDHGIKGYEAEITITISSKYVSPTGFSPIEDIPVLPPVPYVPACGVVWIGTQLWMACNYDIAYPASKVYNNDEANRTIYGGLYTWNQIVAAGFCPSGWGVPTEADWDILIDLVGDITDAGGILKEVGLTHWANPNTGATDAFSFKALPAGYYNYISNLYLLLTQYGYFWTLTESGSTALVIRMDYGAAGITKNYVDKNHFFPVRLLSTLPSSPLMDIEGNVYTTVIIGTQEWIVENYRTTKYSDGSPITNITDGVTWYNHGHFPATGAAYCWYNNDIANKTIYGALYNFNAAKSALFPYLERNGVQEAGWRLPTDSIVDASADWNKLDTLCGVPLAELFLYGTRGCTPINAGLHLKATTGWGGCGSIGLDTYGFKAFSGGRRGGVLGTFTELNMPRYSWFWGSALDATRALVRSEDCGDCIRRAIKDNDEGLSVRLVRDI